MAPQPDQGAPTPDEPMTEQQTSVIDAQPTVAAHADATTMREQQPDPIHTAHAGAPQAQARTQAPAQAQPAQAKTRAQVSQGKAPQSQEPSVETSDPQEKKGIFSEVSVTSAIASALAAATSFALQSKIGLAGSIIGVFVAGAATAIATQVYKGMLAASAEKIRAIPDPQLFSPTTPRAGDGAQQADPFGTDAGSPAAASRGEAAYVDPITGQSVAEQDVDADHTFVRTFPNAAAPVAAEERGARETASTGTRIAPEYMTRAAAKRRHARIKRNAAIAVFAIVLGAVLAYAGIVTWATRGRGIGPTTTETQTQQEEADEAASTGTSTHGTRVRGTQTESGSEAEGDSAQTTTTEATPTATPTTTQTPSQTTSGTTGGSATGTTGGASGSGSGGSGQSGSASGSGSSTGSGTSSGESSSSSSSGTSSGSGSSSQTTGGTSGSTGSTGSTSGTAQAPRHTSS